MDSQESKQLVMQGYQKFQTGDIQGLLELYTDDIEWIGVETEQVPFSGVYHGKAGVADFFKTLDDALQTQRFEPLEFIAEGDRVAVTGQAAWTVRSTGQSYETPWVHLFTVRDGKISRFEHFGDTAAAAAAFGARGGAQTQEAGTSTSILH